MLFVSFFFFSVVTLHPMPMRKREHRRTICSHFFVKEALRSNDIECQKQGDDGERKKKRKKENERDTLKGEKEKNNI